MTDDGSFFDLLIVLSTDLGDVRRDGATGEGQKFKCVTFPFLFSFSPLYLPPSAFVKAPCLDDFRGFILEIIP